MEHSYVLLNLKKITKQRNIVLVIAAALLGANLLLSGSLALMQREIVMVPGILQEYRIKGSKVSSSYLEEMTHMFLANLLDLTPDNVSYKKELVLKYTLAGSTKVINDYFAEAQIQHERFQFSTYFSAKHLEISPEKMEVVAKGILSSRFGRSGNEEKEVEYRLIYEMNGGILRLKSFAMLRPDEEKKALEKLKQEKAKATNGEGR